MPRSYLVSTVDANAKMSEIVSLCSEYVRLSVQRFCPFVRDGWRRYERRRLSWRPKLKQMERFHSVRDATQRCLKLNRRPHKSCDIAKGVTLAHNVMHIIALWRKERFRCSSPE